MMEQRGVEGYFAPGTIAALEEIVSQVFPNKAFEYNTDEVEGAWLATEHGRAGMPDIGTGEIRTEILKYILNNLYWINVCLFVNEDFRACFTDAIMIEKALLSVDEFQYQDFREDMTLDHGDALPGGTMRIDLGQHNSSTETIILNLIRKSHSEFVKNGMEEAYLQIMHDMDKRTQDSAHVILYGIVFAVNAMNRNDVFAKYVRLVVDSVVKSLSAEEGGLQ